MLTVKEHIKAGTHPTCATKEQFTAWAAVARNARVDSFCTDCTANYEFSMRQAGRCEKYVKNNAG